MHLTLFGLALACVGCCTPKVEKPKSGDRFVVESVGMAFRWVPAGKFAMGSTYGVKPPLPPHAEWYSDEAPIHSVTLSRGYWLGETEVTVAQFERFVKETSYKTTAEGADHESEGPTVDPKEEVGPWKKSTKLTWRAPGFETKTEQPVVHVSWQDAVAYCKWLSKHDSKANYRLPTEAEWEYAAGSAKGTLYSWGNEEPAGKAGGNIADKSFKKRFPKWKYPVLDSYDDGFAVVCEVASFNANALGLHDMTGNVWEWVADKYAPYQSSAVTDPKGPDSVSDPVKRVHRGAGFDWELPFLRVTKRRGKPETHTAVHIGFRIVRTPSKAD